MIFWLKVFKLEKVPIKVLSLQQRPKKYFYYEELYFFLPYLP